MSFGEGHRCAMWVLINSHHFFISFCFLLLLQLLCNFPILLSMPLSSLGNESKRPSLKLCYIHFIQSPNIISTFQTTPRSLTLNPMNSIPLCTHIVDQQFHSFFSTCTHPSTHYNISSHSLLQFTLSIRAAWITIISCP